MDNPIKILKLKPGDDIEKAHKKRNALFKKFHPDKNPSNKEFYQKIYEAYEKIKKNPELLKKNNKEYIDNGFVIKIRKVITIEDIYFKRIFSTSYNRKVFCSRCNGTGTFSKDPDPCPYCKGKGHIISDVLDILEKKSACPICRGTKVNIDNLCPKCRGSKISLENHTIDFSINFKNYHERKKIIYDKGHQYDNNKFGRVVITIRVKHDKRISIEDHYFVIQDDILPTQRIIGDCKSINIFGRIVKYLIKRNAKESYTIDYITPDLSRVILIKYNEIYPTLTLETYQKYQQILAIEKKYVKSSYGPEPKK